MNKRILKKMTKLINTSVGVIFSEDGWSGQEIAYDGVLKYVPHSEDSTSGNYHIGERVIPMNIVVRVRQRDYDIGLIYLNFRTEETLSA